MSEERLWMEPELLAMVASVWRLLTTLSGDSLKENVLILEDLLEKFGFIVQWVQDYYPKSREDSKLVVVLHEKSYGAKSKPCWGLYLRGEGDKVEFYLDRVRYEDEPMLPEEKLEGNAAYGKRGRSR